MIHSNFAVYTNAFHCVDKLAVKEDTGHNDVSLPKLLVKTLNPRWDFWVTRALVCGIAAVFEAATSIEGEC